MKEQSPALSYRVATSLGVFVLAVILSMSADWGFEHIKNAVVNVRRNYEDLFVFWDMPLLGVNVPDLFFAVALALIASLILEAIASGAKSRFLAALIGVMVSSWLWHP